MTCRFATGQKTPMNKVIESLGAAFQIAFHLAFGPFLHRRRTRWGTTDEEIARHLPGDDLVPVPTWAYNHAITIDAPRSKIWPWVAQLGQGRGGFYSFEKLENLVGCDIHNVTEIRPELQQLRVGETIRVHGKGFGPPVAIIEPGHALVLGGPPEPGRSSATWAFYLFDGPRGTTRLLERGRHVVGKGIVEKLGFGPYLIDPIGFVMSRKMLRTIKRLAESPATDTTPDRPSVPNTRQEVVR
jgi:hypothetical protein